MRHSVGQLASIRGAVSGLADADFASAGRKLLDAMGYRSPKTLDSPDAPIQFLAALGMDAALFETSRWRAIHFLFQLTGDELPALSRGGEPATSAAFQRGAIDSFVFLSIDLDEGGWSRRQLVAIVRALNRGFAMPAIVLFRHGGHASLTVIDRRANRRDASGDVVGGRISLIKDINVTRPHRAHIEILADLSLAALARRKAPADFRALYDLWLETLSAAELNKRFYEELADWFAWASTSAPLAFPKGQGNGEGAREIALIRLLTRLMFVWFIKEKGLVPDILFDAPALAKLLKEPPASTPGSHGYYLAVLQNLFFATLNTEMFERRWRQDSDGQSKDYLGHHVYRHAALFVEPEKAMEAFSTVPFLNGGLFECLDTEIAGDDSRAGQADRERQRLILRIDGFSDQPDKQPRLPNALFFAGAKGVDLSSWFEKAKAPRDVPGLIDLFDRYKFTVEENTPLEEEAALDPELLGKVFENLLASYNEDTRTTARNKSGSFYTPREVVDFMVDEALVAFLLPKLPRELDLQAAGDEESRLRSLLNFASRSHEFSRVQVDALIAAIEGCKAIDPAVGSGAFPLGLLQKLVHVLDVLDPGGERWKARNRLYYERRLAEAESIPAASERATEIEKAGTALADFDAKFATGHYPDYTRKLFLIDRCLHGVDIQPVAVQIAKLRCFISLAVEQKDDQSRPNYGITPLPNLEAKFVAANTLTPLHRSQGHLVDPAVFDKQRALHESNRAFFAASNGAAKRREQKKIKELRADIAELLTRDGSFAGEDARRLAAWDPFDPNAFAPFFDGEWMFGLDASANEGWFDIALANPPYIRQEKIESFRVNDKPVIAKAQLKADYKTYAGTADIYVYFYERALRLLKPEGALAFITSSKWYRAGYGKGLREWLNTHARILKLLDFGDAPVFEAIAYPTILVGTRKATPGKPGLNEEVKALNWVPVAGENLKESVRHFPERFAAESFPMPQYDLAPGGWQLERQAGRDLLAHLRARGTPLGDWCGGRFYRGVLTGLNEAFIIDGVKRSELIAADPKCAEIIKPFLRGRDVKRWQVEPEDKWLLFIPWHFPLHENQSISGPSKNAETAFRREYPSVYRHLLEWKPELSARNKAETGIRYEWYALQRWASGYWSEFAEAKIIVPAITSRCEAALDFEGRYCNNKATIFVPPHVSYTLGVVNSAASDWFARQTFASKQGGFLDFEPRYSGTIPIPNASRGEQALLSVAVDAITAGAERPHLEGLINAFVYELFFTDELHARNLYPFALARDAGLMKLAEFRGSAQARAANEWARSLTNPAHQLYATIFNLQTIDAIRIIEGRE